MQQQRFKEYVKTFRSLEQFCVASTLRAGQLRIRGSFLSRSEGCRAYQIWGSPSLLFNGHRGVFSKAKATVM
jgi:hypothetical protein